MSTKSTRPSGYTQADLLQLQVVRLEKEHDPRDRYVQLLKAQLDSLRSLQNEPRPNPVTLTRH